jgi:hypothetical protein
MFLDDAPTTVTASCCPNINGMFLFRSLKLANLQQGGVGSHEDACHILGHKIVADLHVLFCAGGSANSPFVFSLSCFLASCTQSRSNVIDYGINKLWESRNVGKRFEDIPSLGKKVAEE